MERCETKKKNRPHHVLRIQSVHLISEHSPFGDFLGSQEGSILPSGTKGPFLTKLYYRVNFFLDPSVDGTILTTGI